MKRKILSLLLAAVVGGSLLAGCTTQKETAKTEEKTEQSAEQKTEQKTEEKQSENSNQQKPSGSTVVVYTNSGSEGRSEWLTAKAAEAGFNIQVVSMGGSALAERIIAEKNNPLCDVIFGLNNIEYEKLKAQDIMQKWQPDWLDGVDPNLVDKDGFYYPVTTTPLVLIGKDDFDDMPSDWTDLIQEKYKDKYQLYGLTGGTGKTVFASVVSRYPDPNGELGISEEGWKVVAAYIGNAHIIAKDGEDPIGNVINGTYPLMQRWASGVLTEQKARNYKFKVMKPEVGEPFVVESVAVAKGAKDYEECVRFLNWLGSSEMQLAWSNEFGTIPCQKEALANVSTEIKEFTEGLKPQQLDWQFIAQNIDAWVEKAELEFVK